MARKRVKKCRMVPIRAYKKVCKKGKKTRRKKRRGKKRWIIRAGSTRKTWV